MGIFKKLKDSLSKTKESFVSKIENLFSGHKNALKSENHKQMGKIYDDAGYANTALSHYFASVGLDGELEEILLQGDVGAEAALDLVDDLRQMVKERKITEPEQLRPILEELILEILEQGESSLNLGESPTVILLVGVNGVGKTTTIGKLAYYFKSQNKKVLLAAGDTLRAAACEQL
ncbi:MAG: signal recognition particle receptor subunit alpha, partial [Clostridia bacterium]|nr:signal recognition particle receptor subunit alpha [Clostridia bacterium]